ncbi:hypothetical protein [Hansschlegelia plantiphila]|uniref:Phage gp6-like head-tail connector protein n=1 Tax=Hansschlegelia plantiphila TaxID=374655 RepID=A0A9W6J2J5_9HYPH|nr:hypothetical protein [Hansschlegelia plantiphila]GLK68105.1 hypothetical protein GCM10008179_17430 [Hansschlegelia plantiphila]
MLTVVTPATSSLLTTVERARSLLGLDAGVDTAAALQRHIATASRVIADYCRRPFGVETLKQWGEGDVLNGIAFARTPVRSIASVSIGNADLAPDEYAIDAGSGSLLRMGECDVVLCWWTAPTIVYEAGYQLPTDNNAGDLPESVERAAIILAGSYFAGAGRDPLLKSEDIDGLASASWYVPGAADQVLVPEVAQILAPYRRFWP